MRHAPGYLAAVLITPVLVLLPPYHDVDLDGVTARYGTVFAMAARPAGQSALIGLLVVAAGTVVNAALHTAFLHGARAEVRSGPPPGRPPAGARSGSRP